MGKILLVLLEIHWLRNRSIKFQEDLTINLSIIFTLQTWDINQIKEVKLSRFMNPLWCLKLFPPIAFHTNQLTMIFKITEIASLIWNLDLIKELRVLLIHLIITSLKNFFQKIKNHIMTKLREWEIRCLQILTSLSILIFLQLENLNTSLPPTSNNNTAKEDKIWKEFMILLMPFKMNFRKNKTNYQQPNRWIMQISKQIFINPLNNNFKTNLIVHMWNLKKNIMRIKNNNMIIILATYISTKMIQNLCKTMKQDITLALFYRITNIPMRMMKNILREIMRHFFEAILQME